MLHVEAQPDRQSGAPRPNTDLQQATERLLEVLSSLPPYATKAKEALTPSPARIY